MKDTRKQERKEKWQKFKKEIYRLYRYASWNNRLRRIKCLIGYHESYPSYCYPSCWVCGVIVFMKEYSDWKKQFKSK